MQQWQLYGVKSIKMAGLLMEGEHQSAIGISFLTEWISYIMIMIHVFSKSSVHNKTMFMRG